MVRAGCQVKGSLFEVSPEDTPLPLLYVAARLGIADLLKDGPKTVNQLAAATDAHTPALYRLMRALACSGIGVEDDNGRFALTEAGRKLLTGASHGWTLVEGEILYKAWGELLHSVRTGEAAFAHVYGLGFYDYLAQNSEAARIWDEVMDNSAHERLASFAATYDFSGVGTLVDVAGGRGVLMAEILKANPAMHGILYDLPAVVAEANPVLEAAGVAHRCEVIGGSMLSAVPAGGDAYMIARALANWDGDQNHAILTNCRNVMKRGIKLLAIEGIMPPPGEVAVEDALADLLLLVWWGTHLRTEVEFRDLFESAGFEITKITPTSSIFKIIETVSV